MGLVAFMQHVSAYGGPSSLSHVVLTFQHYLAGTHLFTNILLGKMVIFFHQFTVFGLYWYYIAVPFTFSKLKVSPSVFTIHVKAGMGPIQSDIEA